MVVFEQAKITSTGKGGTFKAVGKASTELEVTGFGSIINVKKVGVTSLYGQAVDIFSAKLGGGKSSTSLQLSKTGLNLKSSVPGSQQVSGYGSFGLVSASSLTSPTSSDFSKANFPFSFSSSFNVNSLLPISKKSLLLQFLMFLMFQALQEVLLHLLLFLTFLLFQVLLKVLLQHQEFQKVRVFLLIDLQGIIHQENP